MALIIDAPMPKGCEIADHTLKDGVRDCPLSPICDARKKEILKHGTLGDHIIDYYPPNCPIIGEIPTQHGQLKDADSFIKHLAEESLFSMSIISKIDAYLNDAPTVIPASERATMKATESLERESIFFPDYTEKGEQRIGREMNIAIQDEIIKKEREKQHDI